MNGAEDFYGKCAGEHHRGPVTLIRTVTVFGRRRSLLKHTIPLECEDLAYYRPSCEWSMFFRREYQVVGALAWHEPCAVNERDRKKEARHETKKPYFNSGFFIR